MAVIASEQASDNVTSAFATLAVGGDDGPGSNMLSRILSEQRFLLTTVVPSIANESGALLPPLNASVWVDESGDSHDAVVLHVRVVAGALPLPFEVGSEALRLLGYSNTSKSPRGAGQQGAPRHKAVELRLDAFVLSNATDSELNAAALVSPAQAEVLRSTLTTLFDGLDDVLVSLRGSVGGVDDAVSITPWVVSAGNVSFNDITDFVTNCTAKYGGVAEYFNESDALCFLDGAVEISAAEILGGEREGDSIEIPCAFGDYGVCAKLSAEEMQALPPTHVTTSVGTNISIPFQLLPAGIELSVELAMPRLPLTVGCFFSDRVFDVALDPMVMHATSSPRRDAQEYGRRLHTRLAASDQ